MKLTKTDENLLSKVVDREALHQSVLSTAETACWVTRDLAIARRILSDDPSELVVGLHVLARQCWDSYASSRERNRFQDTLWRECLIAAAIHDWELLDKMLVDLPELGRGPVDSQCELLLYESLFSVLRGSYPLAHHASMKKFEKTRLRYFSSLLDCFTAIGDRDQNRFAQTLLTLLKTNRSTRSSTPEDRLVCIDAHGLWEVAKRVDPKLVANWDISRGLPWDAEFHEFTRSLTSPMDLVAVPDRTEGIMKLLELKELRPVV